MALVPLDRDPPPALVRRFGLFWLPAFLVFAGFRVSVGWPLWALAGASILGTLAYPRAMRAIVILLSIVTWPIALVVSTALMTAVYFLLVTPIGLIARGLGHDALSKIDRRRSSYWVERSSAPRPPARYFDPY